MRGCLVLSWGRIEEAGEPSNTRGWGRHRLLLRQVANYLSDSSSLSGLLARLSPWRWLSNSGSVSISWGVPGCRAPLEWSMCLGWGPSLWVGQSPRDTGIVVSDHTWTAPGCVCLQKSKHKTLEMKRGSSPLGSNGKNRPQPRVSNYLRFLTETRKAESSQA